MTTPESPLEKKNETVDVALTLEERVGRLEITLENVYNSLRKTIHESELKTTDERKSLEGELTKGLTLMNISTLQNIVTIREVAKLLIASNTIDEKTLESNINSEMKKAVKAQQEIMEKASEQAMKSAIEGKGA